MKTYQFKLEAVLKIRKFKEESCRMELGQLFMQLGKLEDQLKHDRGEIESYYHIQESALKNGMSAGKIQTFPYLVQGKEKNIELLQRDIKKQNQLILDKKEELTQLRGELKVMENLKEKDYDEYRKVINKARDQTVEEQTQNWLAHKNK